MKFVKTKVHTGSKELVKFMVFPLNFFFFNFHYGLQYGLLQLLWKLQKLNMRKYLQLRLPLTFIVIMLQLLDFFLFDLFRSTSSLLMFGSLVVSIKSHLPLLVFLILQLIVYKVIIEVSVPSSPEQQAEC